MGGRRRPRAGEWHRVHATCAVLSTASDTLMQTRDGLGAALVFKARNRLKFKMDVFDVVVAARPGYLARFMSINFTGVCVEERVESFQRHAIEGYRADWRALLNSVKQMVQEFADYAAKTEGKTGGVGLGVRGEEIKGVLHVSLWDSMKEPICDLVRFFSRSDVLTKECMGLMRRALTADGDTHRVNNYCADPSCEIVYRKPVNGAETDIERVAALCSHPLQSELHWRNTADGSRVQRPDADARGLRGG